MYNFAGLTLSDPDFVNQRSCGCQNQGTKWTVPYCTLFKILNIYIYLYIYMYWCTDKNSSNILDGICQILHVVNKSMMFPNIWIQLQIIWNRINWWSSPDFTNQIPIFPAFFHHNRLATSRPPRLRIAHLAPSFQPSDFSAPRHGFPSKKPPGRRYIMLMVINGDVSIKNGDLPLIMTINGD